MKAPGRICAIIPARKNSVRLPGKNLAICAGVPLIQWTFDAVKAVDGIAEIFISTDDEKVQQYSISKGFPVPSLRNSALAQSESTMVDVLNEIIKQKPDFDIYLLLQPTSPLRTSQHIADAVRVMESTGAQSVVSVTEVAKPIAWAKTLNLQGQLTALPLLEKVKDQKVVIPNGAIYLVQKNWFLKNQAFLTDESIGFEMEQGASVDIDVKLDFQIAEFLLQKGQQ